LVGSSRFAAANAALERLPTNAVFGGLLNFATLIQAAVEVAAETDDKCEKVVYRAVSDTELARQLTGSVGEVIAWPGFIVGVDTIGEAVEEEGGSGSVVVVLRVVVTADAIAARIGRLSESGGGRKVIVAAESHFRVEEVGEVRVGEVALQEVRMSYVRAWSDRVLELDSVS
jgi:hypothetical protein